VKLAAVILAAGSGNRFGGDKLALLLAGKPVWWHSYQAFRQHPFIAEVILVVSEHNYAEVKAAICEDAEVILGGDTRTASSIAGLWKASQIGCEGILFHDGARPFVSAEVISRVAEKVQAGVACAAAIPAVDTMKTIDGPEIDEHLRREHMISMQTPQGAPVEMFALAVTQVSEPVTDDLELLAKAGFRTQHVLGDPLNFKITTPEDADRARAIMGTETRTGLGYDIHRFSDDPARPCWLGGVLFPGEVGLEGHSDADVVLHAVVDALLGATVKGDIGQLFPNTDPANKNRPSMDFLIAARDAVRTDGWEIRHVDIAIQAEKPKIMPRALDIRTAIAEALEIDVDRVSVKATTNEGLGAIGRGEGICAFATASVSR
jgi:2-C-methyl-D-erythritol 4-phosphate cytidylyltransferase / 2-C-methyl-D-erythritol 2,4-cyclodiphosphate synthase